MRSWRLRLLGSLSAGLLVPLIDLWFACRVPSSERCVWGKAYLPFTLPFSIILIGGILFGLLTLFSIAWRDRTGPE